MALFQDRDNLLKYLIKNNIEAKNTLSCSIALTKSRKKTKL